ncbi:MAG TPA: DUF177 domain-containing protein [Acidobacteriota bacterium]|jgi:uncharacterized protein
MLVDVRELHERREPMFWEHTFRPGELPLKSDLYALRNPVHFSGSAAPIGAQDVRLSGIVSARLDLVCGRCLKGFPRNIEKSFDLTYVPNQPRQPDEEIALSYDELDIGFFSDSRIDLNLVITEQIILEIPMKPVCSPECRGLCGKCGADLNLGTCSCTQESADPRLAPLAALRDRLKK